MFIESIPHCRCFQSERRCRQKHYHRQPCRRTGPAGQAGSGRGRRPAGQLNTDVRVAPAGTVGRHPFVICGGFYVGQAPALAGGHPAQRRGNRSSPGQHRTVWHRGQLVPNHEPEAGLEEHSGGLPEYL